MKVSQDSESARSKGGQNHKLILKYQNEPLDHGGTGQDMSSLGSLLEQIPDVSGLL